MSDDRRLVDLRSRADYKPDIAALARNQITTARERLGLTPMEFADVLTPLLGWWPTPAAVESWEKRTVPPGDVLVAASLVTHDPQQGGGDQARADLVGRLISDRFSDVAAVYATRSEFTSSLPPQALFGEATKIRAAGLSLNLLCQHYAEPRLRQLIEGGTSLQCLFLDPAGRAIREREQEEGYPAGHLSALTELNIQILLQRVRNRLGKSAQGHLEVATYDETIRFNIILVDDDTCVVQPYLPNARGVESPTFLLYRRWPTAGLLPMFEQVFDTLWEARKPL